MALSVQFLQELKLRSDIVDIASGYVRLKRAGRSYSGLCPFHNEKTPSFHVYPDSSSFYCFGCHQGGDIITFVEKAENLDYFEAVKLLADRAGLTVPEDSFDNSRAELRNRILEINREAARFFHSSLIGENGKEALGYLRGRQLSPATIRHFGLGYAPASRFALSNHLQSLGYKKDELVQANVAFNTKSGAVVDRFVNRVMFPIIDLRGNVIAFGGRIMTDEKPKYLNTSDTPAFKKSSNLFAFNYAKNSGQDCLILAEGYMDVIALHQAGITNAVATLGTALTEEQAMLIGRYTNDVVICYDADEAGLRASQRAIGILRNAGLKVRILTVPDGKDPDEFIKAHGDKGADMFRRLIEHSSNDIQYRWSVLREQFDLRTPAGKAEYVGKAAEVIAELKDSIERDVYISRLSEESGVDKTAIKLQVDKLAKSRYRTQQKKMQRDRQQEMVGTRDRVNPEKMNNLRAANAEEGIIAYLLLSPSQKMINIFRKELPKERFLTEFCSSVYTSIMEIIESTGSCSLVELSSVLSHDELSHIARISARFSELPPGEEDAERFKNIILQENLKKQVADSKDDSGAGDIEAYLQSLREQKK